MLPPCQAPLQPLRKHHLICSSPRPTRGRCCYHPRLTGGGGGRGEMRLRTELAHLARGPGATLRYGHNSKDGCRKRRGTRSRPSQPKEENIFLRAKRQYVHLLAMETLGTEGRIDCTSLSHSSERGKTAFQALCAFSLTISRNNAGRKTLPLGKWKIRSSFQLRTCRQT